MRLAGGDANDALEGVGRDDALGGRQQERAHRDQVGLFAEDRADQLVGHVRRDAPIVEAAGEPVGERVAVEQTAADDQQGGARRDQHDPDHRQRPRDRRAGPTVPRSRRSALTVAAVAEPRPHSSKLGSVRRARQSESTAGLARAREARSFNLQAGAIAPRRGWDHVDGSPTNGNRRAAG